MSERKKIAILGGGVGAMTAAFELTEEPGWQDKYEITVYQMGWRLGGKGASGRNRTVHDRIEEHGLHLWFGYYENAFRVMQGCYQALGRKPGEPLATWEDAFKKHSAIVLEQATHDGWRHWPHATDENEEVPGDGKIPPLWAVLDRLLKLLHGHLAERGPELLSEHSSGFFSGFRNLLQIGAVDLKAELGHLENARGQVGEKAQGGTGSHQGIIDSMDKFLAGFLGKVKKKVEGAIDEELYKHPDLLRLAEIMELGFAVTRGILADDVINKGFDQLDIHDYREWLKKHGAGPIGLNSTLIRTAYETIFAFSDGDTGHPNLAAGTALRGLLRLIFTYKGAIMWKMQAGMGDTVFGPFYLALRARGVRFKFFHKVKQLELSLDKTRVAAIQMEEQVRLRVPEYDPLFPVNGLPCWPSQPLYEQIDPAQAAELKTRKINLESHWTDWEGRCYPLAEGVDFDEVLFGISIGSIPSLCKQLLDSSEDWRLMVEKVQAVQTQAFQLWTTPDLACLGWDVKLHDQPLSAPVLGGYAEPFNTWADMSHLIEREAWPIDLKPGSIAYFCGPMAGPADVPPPADRAFPDQESTRAKNFSIQWLRNNIDYLWPSAQGKGFAEGFDWSVLVDGGSPSESGEERFDSQFWRSNTDPSERYVLSLKGSTRHRIHPGKTGFQNLTIAGDWTYNGLNYGCVEAAVISGMLASRALTAKFGDPVPPIIYGEGDWF